MSEDTHRLFQQQGEDVLEKIVAMTGHQLRSARPGETISLRQIRREAYACAAMHAILMQPDGGDRPYDFVAQSAFRMADAMLSETARRDASDDVS